MWYMCVCVCVCVCVCMYVCLCVCVYILYKLLYLLFFGEANCLFLPSLKAIHLMVKALIFVS